MGWSWRPCSEVGRDLMLGLLPYDGMHHFYLFWAIPSVRMVASWVRDGVSAWAPFAHLLRVGFVIDTVTCLCGVNSSCTFLLRGASTCDAKEVQV